MNALRRLLARRRLAHDLAEEIREHLDERIDELVAGGVPRDEAVYMARRAFGNPTLLEERARDVWRVPLLDDLGADLRYALRQWRRTPAFAAAAILTLALGIGASTAVFSVVSAVVLTPLPFPDPDRLVAVQAVDRRDSTLDSLSYPNFFDFRREARSFERMASYRDTDLTLTGRGLPVHLRGQIVSWELFQTLGVEPSLGRAFVPEDERPGGRVVILSHDTWITHFGGDRTIVGHAVGIDGEAQVVVGVAPPGFTFPIAQGLADIWTTLARDAASATNTPVTEQRGSRLVNVVARLAPGVSVAQAHAEANAIAGSLVRRYPDDNASVPGADVRPELDRLLGVARDAVLILWAAVGLVLLAACANVAQMLAARTADRARELDMRLAIGGSARRILRQLATENLLLAVAGVAAGLVVARLALGVLLPMAEGVPRVEGIRIDARVFAFSALAAALTTFLVSLPAAVRLGRADSRRSLQAPSRTVVEGRHRVRGAAVIVQIAVSLSLLSAATWLAAAFLQMIHRDLGFDPRHLMTLKVSLPSQYGDVDRRTRFIEELVGKVRVLPEVRRAAAAMPTPLAGHQLGISFEIEGRPSRPGARPTSDMAIVTPGYFAAIATPIIAGRDFGDADDHRHPRVAVVNQAFADKFFPAQSPIGRRIRSGATGPYDDDGPPMREIVGVVGNARQSPVALGPEPIYYLPFRQMPWGAALLVRSELPPESLMRTLRHMVSGMDSQAAVHGLATFEATLARGVAGPQLVVLLMGSFAIIALVLTATGLYGLLAYGVQQRTREIGVRVALGATRPTIVKMVTRDALVLVVAGLLVGGLGVVAVTGALRAQLSAAGPPPPLMLAMAAALVVATALVSSAVPARRAASVDPSEALRSE